MLSHRLISTIGNRHIYNLSNDIFFKGQKDFLCSKDKNFDILKDSTRYNNHETEEKIEIVKNKFIFKNRFNFIKMSIDKFKKVV